MEMKPQLAEAFNRHIALELESSLAYLQMAAYFEAASLPGMASWMRLQSEEERAHALKFFDFLLDRGNDVTLVALGAPRSEFESPADVFHTALEQEQKVSAAIAELHRTATEAGDAASYALLQWFLEEQVEEEATVGQILDQLRLAGDEGTALLLLDRELGARGPSPA
ncbi:MAG: ferritin [Acidimicrobiia bacterium]|jgi:ferritin